MNTRLANMLKEGIIPHREGVWIDCYNQSVSDIAGTILAGITDKNHYFITMETKIAEPINPMEDGVSRTIKAQYDQTSMANFKRGDAFAATPVAANDGMKLRIRKLTERECFRLMDVPDSYIDKMQSAGISRHQQYKLAGNSIVVNCIFLIFKNLFIGCEEQPQQLTLF